MKDTKIFNAKMSKDDKSKDNKSKNNKNKFRYNAINILDSIPANISKKSYNNSNSLNFDNYY